MKHTNIIRRIATLAVALLCVAGVASAQVQSGNLYGTVADNNGAALPGTTVSLSGTGATQTQVTDAQGQFRFLGLSPGTWTLEASLEGFSTVSFPNIVINVNRNTTIEVAMSPAVEETITVTAESPLLDSRKISAGNTVSKTELEKIPSARDPWAILQSTPGVLTDRINVGGNESGQQSQYQGPGAQGDQGVWSLDGMVITDMAAIGSSPGYYDFDAFEEMQVSTGGSDINNATPGVALNMVTKRGTNEWRGSGRYLLADDSLQSNLDFDQGDLGKATNFSNGRAQASFKQGNRITKIVDWGVEGGGPIVKDRLWVWGSYAKPKIQLKTITDYPDVTELPAYNGKINAQLGSSNSATLFVFDSAKTKTGRNAGPTRPPETTWNQDGYGDWPGAGKIEDTQIVSSSFILSAMYSIVNGGFQLRPQGGDRAPFRDANGFVWHNSFFDIYPIDRPQKQYKADGSSFFNTGSLSHELKFGAGYREADQFTISNTPGGGYEIDLSYLCSVFAGYCVGQPFQSYYAFSRDSVLSTTAKYTSVYVQDTMTAGNLTANIGVRYDKQTGQNNPTTSPANRYFPRDLPTVNYGGQAAGFTWEDITPRLGLTYALGAERKTLLRASYSQYADQLSNGNVGQLNPNALQAYMYWYGYTNGNGTLRPSDLYYFYQFSGNVNPFTGGLLQSNAVDKNLTAPLTSEAIFGVEHALLPEFVVGMQFTWRKTTDLLENELLVFDGNAYSLANMGNVGRRHQRSDYVLITPPAGTTLPDGTPYSRPAYNLRSGVTTRRGTYLENGDREWDYKGLSLTATKRLSNRWMMRGNISWSDWKWNTPASEIENPTPGLGGGFDGEIVLQGSGTVSGSKGNVWINSGWSYALNALYQVAPDKAWGFNIGANFTGREGYPLQYAHRTNTNWGGSSTDVRVTSKPDSYRNDDVHTMDLRLDKDVNLGDFGMTFSVDCFNVLNQSTVLQRQALRGNTGNFVQEIMSPRVFRLGVKLHFR